jgi:hypothetical protein
MIIEEAFQPFLQTVTVIAKLRGLNPALAQLSADRAFFTVPDETELAPVPVRSNGINELG